MARYPRKTGRCEISGCRNTPTDWHHVISQNQIRKRGLPTAYYTDPGNLKEFCRKHHDMTTASMDRKRLTKKHGPLGKRKPRMTEAERNAAKKKAKEEKKKQREDFFNDVIAPSLDAMHSRGAANPKKHKRPNKKIWHRFTEVTEWEGTSIEMAYPPDHWLHDPEQYNEDLNLIIEAGGRNVWCNGAGITICHDNWRQSGSIPPYTTHYMFDDRKQVICAKCNRVGHESKECYAKTKVAGTGVLAHLERKGLPKR